MKNLTDKEKIAIKEISKKYCKSEKYVLILFKISKDLNCENIKKEVENYLLSVSKCVSTKTIHTNFTYEKSIIRKTHI